MQFLKDLGIVVAVIFVVCLAVAIGVVVNFYLMWLMLLWSILSAVVGVVARERERDILQFFALAFFLSPAVAAAILALLPNLREERLAEARHAELLDTLLRVGGGYQENYG